MAIAAFGRRRALPAWAACVLSALVLCPPAHATSLQISPVRIDLPAGPGAAAITLRNASGAPIHAQVRVFRWTQADGADVLTPTDDAVASPPILRIAGNGEQMGRVVRPLDPVLRNDASTSAVPPTETAYRLLIDELPQREAQVDQSGVRVQLRYSVPVFAGTPADAPLRLKLTMWRDQDEWKLAVRNDGARHARISGVAVINGPQRVTVTEGLLGYALPGATRIWKIHMPAGFAPTGSVRIEGDINGEPRTLPVGQGKPVAGS